MDISQHGRTSHGCGRGRTSGPIRARFLVLPCPSCLRPLTHCFIEDVAPGLMLSTEFRGSLGGGGPPGNCDRTSGQHCWDGVSQFHVGPGHVQQLVVLLAATRPSRGASIVELEASAGRAGPTHPPLPWPYAWVNRTPAAPPGGTTAMLQPVASKGSGDAVAADLHSAARSHGQETHLPKAPEPPMLKNPPETSWSQLY